MSTTFIDSYLFLNETLVSIPPWFFFVSQSIYISMSLSDIHQQTTLFD